MLTAVASDGSVVYVPPIVKGFFYPLFLTTSADVQGCICYAHNSSTYDLSHVTVYKILK
jgi:hypothetical protein